MLKHLFGQQFKFANTSARNAKKNFRQGVALYSGTRYPAGTPSGRRRERYPALHRPRSSAESPPAYSERQRPRCLISPTSRGRRFLVTKNTVNINRRECISYGPSLISIVPPGHTSTATALNAEMSKLQGPSGCIPGAKHHYPRKWGPAVDTGNFFILPNHLR
jgi:hypothetical protein